MRTRSISTFELANLNIEIRKHVEAVGHGKIVPANAAALDLLPEDIRTKHLAAVDLPEKRWNDCATLLQDPDTTTAALDAAYSALRKAEADAVESSDTVRDWFDSRKDELVASSRKENEADALEALGLLAQVRELGERIALRNLALARSRDSRDVKRWTPRGGLLRLPGGESIANAEHGFTVLLSRPKPRLVSPANMKALQAGQDAEDIKGAPISFEEADALFRAGLLKISFGPLASRGSGPRE